MRAWDQGWAPGFGFLRVGLAHAGVGSSVLQPALSLDLQAGRMHGICKLGANDIGQGVRVAVAAASLTGEPLGEDHAQRVERPQIHSPQRQAGGVQGIMGDGQRIDSVGAGWHGHPPVVGATITVLTMASGAAAQIGKITVRFADRAKKRCAGVRKISQHAVLSE
jgi:hypothetical protein